MNSRRDRRSIIYLSLVLAVVLTLLPLPGALDLLRPYWVALVLLYWCLETQDFISLGMVFAVGLVLAGESFNAAAQRSGLRYGARVRDHLAAHRGLPDAAGTSALLIDAGGAEAVSIQTG